MFLGLTVEQWVGLMAVVGFALVYAIAIKGIYDASRKITRWWRK